jgi:NADPH:quinone reductase-like Zn-dependent oxidoreductase
MKSRLVGPLGHIIGMKLRARFSRRRAIFFLAKPSAPDLVEVAALVEARTVNPVIAHRYPLSEIAAAFRYLGDGHAQGKIVVDLAL